MKDKEGDLTREREQIKAYRDTWTSASTPTLAYLRDRLIVAKELLTDSGSIFVQIGDENVHRVRCIMDEVFGVENCISIIWFSKTTGQASSLLPSSGDYILWYCKDRDKVKYQQLYWKKTTTALAS